MRPSFAPLALLGLAAAVVSCFAPPESEVRYIPDRTIVHDAKAIYAMDEDAIGAVNDRDLCIAFEEREWRVSGQPKYPETGTVIQEVRRRGLGDEGWCQRRRVESHVQTLRDRSDSEVCDSVHFLENKRRPSPALLDASRKEATRRDLSDEECGRLMAQRRRAELARLRETAGKTLSECEATYDKRCVLRCTEARAPRFPAAPSLGDPLGAALVREWGELWLVLTGQDGAVCTNLEWAPE